MIIDAHYHLEERMEPMERLIQQMDKHGIDRIALMATLVDVIHVNPFVDKLSWIMRRFLMSRIYFIGRLIYKTTMNSRGQFKILWKKFNIYQEPDNETVAKAMQSYPDRFYGWICINPSQHDPVAEIEKWAGKPGWIGVKCHSFWHRYPLDKLNDAAALCSEKGMPIVIHLGLKDSGNYRLLPEKHPGLKLIYAHAGLPYFRELWDYIKNRKNLFIDLSGAYIDHPIRKAALKTLGVEKCIYGTDGPYGFHDTDGMHDHGAIIREIDRLKISDRERERILGGIFSEIIGI